MNARVTRRLVLMAVAGIVLVACGDDADERSGTRQAKQQAAQEAPGARAAERLERYLRQNTKDITGSAPGQVLSHVEAVGKKLKVWTLLNAAVATDAAPAREVCRAVKASGVPEAESAVIVDAGDALIRRC